MYANCRTIDCAECGLTRQLGRKLLRSATDTEPVDVCKECHDAYNMPWREILLRELHIQAIRARHRAMRMSQAIAGTFAAMPHSVRGCAEERAAWLRHTTELLIAQDRHACFLEDAARSQEEAHG
ncbi:MAG TPA: hypothetical protein DEQ43_09760 [Nocardioides bacterium]|nr:hypothetical protein [Nocardioides sp.]